MIRKSFGSPLYLKIIYDIGYRLTIKLKNSAVIERLLKVISDQLTLVYSEINLV